MRFWEENDYEQILFAVVAILFVACDPGNQPPTGKDNKPDSELDTTIQFAMQYCEDTILTALLFMSNRQRLN